MPSREEIAGWLREAADLAYDYSPEGVRLWDIFDQRAAQVENMCCETCDNYIPEEVGESCILKQIDYQGKSFGCFSWEAKED